MFKLSLGRVLVFSLLLVIPAAAQPAPALRSVTVDASAVVGSIKALNGFNGSPERPPAPPRAGGEGAGAPAAGAAPGRGGANPPTPLTPAQIGQFYRQLGITTSRTHDTGGGDTMYGVTANPNVIFPDKNADPDREASYNFGPTDLVISAMLTAGVEPYFRIGDGHDGFVPDFDKFAQVARHIVLHYNKGWDNGYRLGIKYWEFWNEPDFVSPGPAQFWAGNAQQYFEFYGKVAPLLKAADPAVLIGAPATGGHDAQYERPFLKYLRDHKLPLDFYAYHWYAIGSNDPYDYVRMTDEMRAELKEFGYGNIPIFNTEYGQDLFNPMQGVQRSAFFSAALDYMQDTSLDQAWYHSAGVGPLFDANGLTPAGLIFQAHTSMQATPQRLKATGGDTVGFHVLAGRASGTSSDTSQEIRILITNYEIPPDDRGPLDNGKGLPAADPYKGDLTLFFQRRQARLHPLPRRSPVYKNNGGYDLKVDHLPAWAAKGYSVNRYRMDETHNMTLVDSVHGTEKTLHLSSVLPAPSVDLIVIRGDSAGAPRLEGLWGLGSATRAH